MGSHRKKNDFSLLNSIGHQIGLFVVVEFVNPKTRQIAFLGYSQIWFLSYSIDFILNCELKRSILLFNEFSKREFEKPIHDKLNDI